MTKGRPVHLGTGEHCYRIRPSLRDQLVNVFETSEHRDPHGGQLRRLAAIRDAGPDDSHAMMSIITHLAYQVGGGTAMPDKENLAHELTAAAPMVHKLSR
jgi:hypothetical protein